METTIVLDKKMLDVLESEWRTDYASLTLTCHWKLWLKKKYNAFYSLIAGQHLLTFDDDSSYNTFILIIYNNGK